MQRNEPIDAETLLSTPLPPVRWLIPGLLPAGLSLLAGASKAGKSWLCLWLCLQLARGGEIWGRTTQPQTVLYLCLEDTYARIQGRLFRLTEDSVPSRLYFQTGSCPMEAGKIRFPAPKNIPNSILATSSRCRNVSCCILFPPAAHSAPPRQMRRGAAGQSSFFSFLSFFSLSLRSFEGSALSPSSRSSSAAGSG